MRYRHVIWDWNGTLLDTLGGVSKSLSFNL